MPAIVIVHPIVRRAELVLACISATKPRDTMSPAELFAMDWTINDPTHTRQIAHTLRALASQHANPTDYLIAAGALETSAAKAQRPSKARSGERHDVVAMPR